jgi:K+-sensing histidine kinase KdpD
LTGRAAGRDPVTLLRGALITTLAAAVIMGVAVGIKYVIWIWTGESAGFVIYVPALALAAWYRGFLGGVLATMIGAFLDTVIFVPPLLVLALDVEAYALRLIAYLSGGVAISYLAYRLRRERDRAQGEAAERRKLLENAAQTREELARLVDGERRASELRDAFNSIVSHELRTPITAIYGGAKLLARRDRVLDDQTRQELLDDMEEEADRLYRLVEDLLVLSRSERGLIERAEDPVLLQRVAERVVRSERDRWPAVTFETKTGPAPTARGDETYVEQVLRNLLSNAAKYSPTNSTVTISVDETSEGVRTRVLDEGKGVDPAESGRLFELYYRSPATSTTVSGAGIGLFVCRALIEAMGGRIWASNRAEGGAEFGFVLARHEEDERVPAT